MRDPSDSRDVGPRFGSPLWIYLTAVSAAGFALLAVAIVVLSMTGLPQLLVSPLLWVIAALALIGELRPIVTPGKSGSDSPAVSFTFCFAALLYWGFPTAALLLAAATLTGAVLARRAIFRAVFNTGQYTLSLGAAGLVLAALGIRPGPLAPWVPDGDQLLAVAAAAAAYGVANFVLVLIAVALHTRTTIRATARSALPYQAFVNLVLLSAAPLVVVVMGRSVVLVLLFLVPMIAVYANSVLSLKREHQVHHDELTGLPNRALLHRQTAQALATAAREGRRAGFLLLDLDRFKEVNDTLGHPVGDALLRVIATRLARSVRPGDLVARLGGDEFAVLLPLVREGSVAREVALRLRAALAEPVRLEGMSFTVEASIGVALYPDDATAAEVLLQRADVAMYLAKERRSGVEMYAHDADRNSPARLSLLGDLRRGIDRGELELHYQPKVSLADGAAAGMEALVRWRHPVRGLIMPREFLMATEQSSLMRDLTGYVVDAALAQAAQWHRDGLGVQVSVNLSTRDLLDPGLVDMIRCELRRHGLPPSGLLVEINERMLAGEPAQTSTAATALASMGVPLSLDDFGTGYSSLARLRRLPVSEVKIDASFVTRLADSQENEVIVRSMVELVHALGIRSVAEGVESADVAAALCGVGCDEAQGRHFSPPLEPAAATAWLAEHLMPAGGAGVPPCVRAGSGGGRPAGLRAVSPVPPAGAVDK